MAGFIFVANDASQSNVGNNFLVYNNTFYNIRGSYSGVIIQSGSNNAVQNNIWYSSVRTNNSFSGPISYNWYFNTTQDGDSSPTKVVCSSNCSIFVDAANKNFALSKAVPAGNPLPAPYNVDLADTVRGLDGAWDRGAYEFSTGSTAPAQPLNLRIIS